MLSQLLSLTSTILPPTLNLLWLMGRYFYSMTIVLLSNVVYYVQVMSATHMECMYSWYKKKIVIQIDKHVFIFFQLSSETSPSS